jgi:cold shock CspA family protein
VKGVVTKIFRDRGYGFVRGEDGHARFLHASEVDRGMFDALSEGSCVDFTPVLGPRGPRAAKVTLLIGVEIE